MRWRDVIRVIARIKEFISDLAIAANTLPADDNRPDSSLGYQTRRPARRKIRSVLGRRGGVEAVLAPSFAKTASSRPWTYVDEREFSQKLVGTAMPTSRRCTRGQRPAAHDSARSSPAEIDTFLRRSMITSHPTLNAGVHGVLAVFESSSRRMLPPKYAAMTPEEMDVRCDCSGNSCESTIGRH